MRECPFARFRMAAMSALAPSRVLMRFAQRPSAAVRLLCIPHAGGGASSFRLWATAMPQSVDVVVAQFPGRESRIRDRPLTCIDAMVEELLPAVLAQPPLPLVVMAHSMGSIVAFELSHALRNAEAPAPMHLFVSGSRAPGDLDDGLPLLHRMSDEELLIEIDRRYGGIPATVREQRDVIELLLPMLRGDITALETYERRERDRLAFPITAYAGTRDARATPDAVAAWREETTGTFASRGFDGDHFFLHSHRENILPDVRRALEDSMAAGLGAA
jgi:medium-chain acyl-[acyl-carrier-protein] hydrolase